MLLVYLLDKALKSMHECSNNSFFGDQTPAAEKQGQLHEINPNMMY